MCMYLLHVQKLSGIPSVNTVTKTHYRRGTKGSMATGDRRQTTATIVRKYTNAVGYALRIISTYLVHGTTYLCSKIFLIFESLRHVL